MRGAKRRPPHSRRIPLARLDRKETAQLPPPLCAPRSKRKHILICRHFSARSLRRNDSIALLANLLQLAVCNKLHSFPAQSLRPTPAQGVRPQVRVARIKEPSGQVRPKRRLKRRQVLSLNPPRRNSKLLFQQLVGLPKTGHPPFRPQHIKQSILPPFTSELLFARQTPILRHRRIQNRLQRRRGLQHRLMPTTPGKSPHPTPQGRPKLRAHSKRRVRFEKRSNGQANGSRFGQRQHMAWANKTAIRMRTSPGQRLLFNHRHPPAVPPQIMSARNAHHAAAGNQNRFTVSHEDIAV